jgi:hypothetical protein
VFVIVELVISISVGVFRVGRGKSFQVNIQTEKNTASSGNHPFHVLRLKASEETEEMRCVC